MKTKRISSGNYTVQQGGREVSIFRVPPNPAYGDKREMWIAQAEWDRHLYSDPVETLKQAKLSAATFLNFL